MQMLQRTHRLGSTRQGQISPPTCVAPVQPCLVTFVQRPQRLSVSSYAVTPSGREWSAAGRRQTRVHAVEEVATPAPAPVASATQATDTSSASDAAPGGGPPGFDINERTAFLREDLKHLFDDQGIDATAYDSQVRFVDPITKYASIQGYLFNIQMLRRVFSPTLEVHDIRPLSDYAIVSRWTMTMDFIPSKYLPTAPFWSPKLVFTGTSTYGFNPANGKINLHVDTWDSISNQAFFSVEAFGDFWRQLLATYTVPKGLEQPEYTILKRASDYEIRRYKPFLVAETPLDTAKGQVSAARQFNPASGGFGSFNTLARFIFGGNEKSEKMEMTTPVFSDTRGTMQFVIGPSAHKDLDTVPKPLPGAQVTAKVEPETVFAVRLFGGIATEGNSQEEADKLAVSLERDGLLFDKSAGWRLARYNDPGTLPPFRRNEVLIQLQGPFELWRPGELEALTSTAVKETTSSA